MVEKGIRGGISHGIYNNNKYMKHYDKNKEPSYLKYWDVNNIYGWAMSQTLPVNGFKWVEDLSEFYEVFIKSYNEKSKEGFFLVEYPKKLHEVHNDLPLLPEKINIEKVEKLVANLHNKNEYVIDIRNSKQALNHGLVLKKVHRVTASKCIKAQREINRN